SFRQTFEAIDDRDQYVADAAAAQLVKHLQPELGALGLLDPDAQHVTGAIGQHAERQIDRFVAHDRVVADLHAQGIEEHHRIHRFQWPTLPGDRSEEHTSELQSRENLVCRLLLEKKKNKKE